MHFSNLIDKIGLHKKTFFRIFLFSVIFSSTVLVIITLILYLNFERASRDEIQKKSVTGLIQTMNVFSSLNSSLVSSSIQLVSEQAINDLIYSKDLDQFMISKGISRLDSAMASYPLLQSIYVYNNKRSEYYSTIHGMEGRTPSDNELPFLMNNIKKYKIYNYIPRKMAVTIQSRIFSPYHGSVEVNVITLVAGEMPFKGNTIKGACVINVSEEKLRNTFLTPGGGQGGDLVIADRNKIALFHTNKKYFSTDLSGSFYMKLIAKEGKKDGTLVAYKDNVKYLVAYVIHPQMGWIFVNITPYDMIFSGINNLRNFTIAVFLFMIIFSIAAAFVLALRIYKPIQNLVLSFTKVRDKLNLKADEKTGEFQYFNSIFQNVVKKAEDLDDYIEKHKRGDSGDLLRNIVTGNIQPSEIMDDYQREIKTFFENKKFQLALITIDRFAVLAEDAGKESVGEWFRSVSEIISRYFKMPHHLVPMEKNIFVLILAHDSAGIRNAGQIKECFLAAQEEIKEKMKFTVSLALGGVITNENGIPSEYINLQKLLTVKFKYGNNSFLETSNVVKFHTEYVFPEKKNEQLFGELKLGRLDKVQILLKDIFDETADYSYEDFRLLVMLLAHSSLKVINNLEQDTHLSMDETRRFLNNLHWIDTITDAFDVFLTAFTSITRSVSSFKANKKNDYIKAIREYVINNLYDFSLCPDSLSSVIGFSTHHIRNIFKEETGTSLSDYINDLRIDHGKKLLLETNLTVKEISRNCGFLNYNYFFTSFKKHTGVTPDFYRQKNKKY
jgi:two-component system, response regulator YesN